MKLSNIFVSLKKRKKLIIIGAGGHGRVAADIAKLMKKYSVIYFLDDKQTGKVCGVYDIIGKTSDVYKYVKNYDIFIAIGNAELRKKLFFELKKTGASVPVLIHPSSIIANDVCLDAGTIVMAGAVINPNSKIGIGCIINTGATVDHDCKVCDFAHISVGSHLAGNVFVGEKTWVGIGSSVINNINIANNCVIGAGAVLVKDIKETGTYVGVPAKKIK